MSLIAALALAASPKPESFSIPPGVEAMKLSPDGRYLALVCRRAITKAACSCWTPPR
ncbi:MAG: hypothetical protein JNL89_03410 [Rhodanobacteraceae bacterium]|nr:hypothetical protein [Rhodanobacteraceae bacterium]